MELCLLTHFVNTCSLLQVSSASQPPSSGVTPLSVRSWLSFLSCMIFVRSLSAWKCSCKRVCVLSTSCLCFHTPADEGRCLSGWCRWNLPASCRHKPPVCSTPGCRRGSEIQTHTAHVNTERINRPMTANIKSTSLELAWISFFIFYQHSTQQDVGYQIKVLHKYLCTWDKYNCNQTLNIRI